MTAGKPVDQPDLHRMVLNGTTWEIPVLIKQGADVNARDSLGRTALHIAAQRGNVEAWDCLKEWGGDDLLKDNYGNTAWDVAYREGVLKSDIEDKDDEEEDED